MSRRRRRGGTRRATRATPVGGNVTALRLARVGVFAAVCVVITALGHSMMSGDLLPWWVLGPAFAGAAAGTWWLTGRERGAWTVVGTTVAAQGLLHVLFDAAHVLVRGADGGTDGGTDGEAAAVSGPGQDLPISSSGIHLHLPVPLHMGHSGSGMVMEHVGTTPRSSGAEVLESVVAGQSSAGMSLVHLVIAVGCGLWLWRGEAAVHRMGRALAVLLLAPLRRVRRMLASPGSDRRAGAGRAAVAAAAVVGSPGVAVLLRHAVVRRGPPWAGAAVLQLSPGQSSAVRP
ncbi:hypothetical protein ACWCPF_11725 [Streptomyces sp. NPDC001858]